MRSNTALFRRCVIFCSLKTTDCGLRAQHGQTRNENGISPPSTLTGAEETYLSPELEENIQNRTPLG